MAVLMEEVEQALSRLRNELKLFRSAADGFDRRLSRAMKSSISVFGIHIPHPIFIVEKILSRFAWWRNSGSD